MTTTLLGVALTTMTCAAGFLYLLWNDAAQHARYLESTILYLDKELSGCKLSIDAAEALREQAHDIREWAEEQKESGDE
jgi:hypothetical protein